jgi:hypothetical protein
VHFDVSLPNAPKITADDRYKAARVALGDKCEGRSFYDSLRTERVESQSRAVPIEMDDREVAVHLGEEEQEVSINNDDATMKVRCVQQWQEFAASVSN